jgi:uncharacterized DUF497 family protein
MAKSKKNAQNGILSLDYPIFYGYNNYAGDDIELEWDESKRQQTLKDRKLDFKLARYVLTDPNMVCRIDNRRNYEETRYIAYGMVQDDVLCLCYTLRNNVYRVISLRHTHKKEREKHYGQNSENDRQRN